MAEKELSFPTIEAKQRYDQLSPIRDHYLNRARDGACVTIPAVMPRSGFSSSSKLPTPYQSVGSRGVNSLASKMLMALLPPNTPFFKYLIPAQIIEQLSNGDEEAKSKAQAALANVEKAIMEEVDAAGIRAKAADIFQHLIIPGNVLVNVPKKKNSPVRTFHLDQYVVLRNPQGEVLEIIVKEQVSEASIPQDVKDRLAKQPSDMKSSEVDPHTGSVDPRLDMFTAIIYDRRQKTVFEWQEIEGVRFNQRTMPLDKSEWLPLRWKAIDGESYGRGFVEDYLGDLLSFEALSKAIITAASAAAKVIFLVRPNGTTNVRVLAEAPSGAIRQGNAEDVQALHLDKAADMRVALETMGQIEARLNDAFLMVAGVQRDAERVTAEEVRLVATELEETLGGTYTVLADEFQRPLVDMLTNRMTSSGIMPEMPKDLVRVSIVTGLEALGRGHDFRRLLSYWKAGVEAIGPEAMVIHHNVDELLRRLAVSTGIDEQGLTRSKDEVQAERQSLQQQALTQQVAPDIVKSLGRAVSPDSAAALLGGGGEQQQNG